VIESRLDAAQRRDDATVEVITQCPEDGGQLGEGDMQRAGIVVQVSEDANGHRDGIPELEKGNIQQTKPVLAVEVFSEGIQVPVSLIADVIFLADIDSIISQATPFFPPYVSNFWDTL